MSNFHEFLHTMYKYMLHSVVKISMMFAKYFEYYAIILRGGGVFCEHAVVHTLGPQKNYPLCRFHYPDTMTTNCMRNISPQSRFIDTLSEEIHYVKLP